MATRKSAGPHAGPRAGPRAGVGGYEYSFVDEIPSKYYCNICSKVLREAHLTVCCGQHYCDSCLQQWFASATQRRTKTCPHCRQEGFQSFPNKEKIREINEFRVKCTNHEKGCDWVGELGDLEKHIKSDDGCGYEVVRCGNYGYMFFATKCIVLCERRSLAKHRETCRFRSYKCEHCGHINTYDAIAGSGRIHLDQCTVNTHPGLNHYGVCRQYPVKCPNKCGEKAIKRFDISDHREKCPLESLDCPFKNVGCTSKKARRDMEGHCQTNTQTHLLMMMKSHDELLRKNTELEHQSQSVMRRLEALERGHGSGFSYQFLN